MKKLIPRLILTVTAVPLLIIGLAMLFAPEAFAALNAETLPTDARALSAGTAPLTSWVFYGCLWLGFVSAIVAGVFLSFSDFVMKGLIRSKSAGGIEAMQQLNRTVFRSIFLQSFLWLVPLSIAFAVYAAAEATGGVRAFIVAGAATYFALVFLVTIAANVPLNNRLDRLQPESDEAAQFWTTYARQWTRWNHVRTAGATATAAFFLLAVAADRLI